MNVGIALFVVAGLMCYAAGGIITCGYAVAKEVEIGISPGLGPIFCGLFWPISWVALGMLYATWQLFGVGIALFHIGRRLALRSIIKRENRKPVNNGW